MKILVVEDEQRIAASIKRGLEIKSHVVDLAYDGEEGYEMAGSDEYELLILDRMLPKMDGLTLCKQLRADGIQTPVLMLTAKTEVEDRVDGLDGGADDYLGKPFAFEELLARVRALGRRPGQTTQSKISVADLELDLAAHQVTRAGQEIDLSPKEFALLSFLIRHPGQVFSADQLVEKVWSYESDVLANTVQVYVGYLRSKVDQPFTKNGSPALIQTVRGAGYRLKASTKT